MKIAIISDLHIKQKDQSSDFFLSDDEFYNFLINLVENHEKVLIDGDLFELWQGKWPTTKSIVEEFENTVEAYKKSINYIFNNSKISIIVGNHDVYLLQRSNLPKRILNYWHHENIHVVHGVYDLFNQKLPKVARVMSWMAGIGERVFGSEFDEGLDEALQNSIFKPFSNRKQIKESIEIIKENPDIDIVINGHTHYRDYREFYVNGQLCKYINTGRFNGRKMDVTVIDTETDEIVQNNIIKKFKTKDVRQSLKKGDYILSGDSDNIVSNAIKSVTDSNYSHAMIYIGHGRVLEAVGKGVIIAPVDKYFDGGHDLLILRLNDRSKVGKIIKYLNKKLGRKYSKIQIVVDLILVGIKKLTGKDFRRDWKVDIDKKGEVCSELQAEGIWKVMQKRVVPGINPSETFPSDFIKSKLFHKITEYVIEGQHEKKGERNK